MVFNIVTGGYAKKTDPSFLVPLIKWDVKRALKDKNKAWNAEDDYVKAIERDHSLLKGDEVFHKYLTWSEKGIGYGYKTGLREMLLLKGMLLNLHRFLEQRTNSSKDISGYIKHIQNALKKQGNHRHNAMYNFYEDLKVKRRKTSGEFRAHVDHALGDVELDLQSVRKNLHGLENATLLRDDMSLLLKKRNISYFRVIPLRFHIGQERKQLTKLIKDEDILIVQNLEMKKLLARTWAYMTDKTPKKADKSDKKNQDLLMKEERSEEKIEEELIEDMKTFIQNQYRIMIYDLMILKVFISLADSNIVKNREFLEKNFLPQVYGKEKMEFVFKDLKVLRNHLFNMETFIKQLWGLTVDDIRESKLMLAAESN